MNQWVVLAVALSLLAACSSKKQAVDPAEQQKRDAEQQRKDCADPAWKEAHLGVWYSVCRPNAAVK